jgi:hypothetical protein
MDCTTRVVTMLTRTGYARGCLAVAIAVIVACSGVRSKTNSFATLTEARQAGAIEHGWVPDGLPAGAHDLREAHLPDSTKRWGLFEYPQAEQETLRVLLTSDELSLDGQHCDIPSRIEWWPIALRGDLDGARIAATGLRAYRSKTGDLIFAVNWRQGRAYYWAP